MRTHLLTEATFPVDPQVMRTTGVKEFLVGDRPVMQVSAIAQAGSCKETVAYFDAQDGRFISSWFPDYRAVTGQKLAWEVVRAVQAGEDWTPVIVCGSPEGLLTYDELAGQGEASPDEVSSIQTDNNRRVTRLALEDLVAKVALLDGVRAMRVPGTPLYPCLPLEATADAVRALAAMPEVEGISSNAPIRVCAGTCVAS